MFEPPVVQAGYVRDAQARAAARRFRSGVSAAALLSLPVIAAIAIAAPAEA